MRETHGMRRFCLWQVLLALIFAGCSIDISQPTTAPAPTAPAISQLSPKGKGPGDAEPAAKIPVTWGSLKLSGKLIYLAGFIQQIYQLIDVQSLDLTTGSVTTLFQTPIDAWVDAAAISPDGQHVIIAYVPPVGGTLGGQEALYVMPADGSKPPALLFKPVSDKDRYYQPAWSPDGQYLYFTDVNYAASAAYEIVRMAYPDGPLEKVTDNAYWPRVSPDGAQLVYVTVDAATGINRLFIAQADGSAAHEIPLSGVPAKGVIDGPIILPGGQMILFSAPPAQPALAPAWAERRLGISVASAHAGVPSDWWTVPVTGGAPTQLTHVASYALFASLSPDGKYVASFSSDGVFVMRPDGTGLTAVVSTVGYIPGTVDWAP
jgi:Tol biopolymer transport system component